MDIAAECRAVEAKLRGLANPPIFVNPDVYDSSDVRNFVSLVRKVVNSLPLELHEILIAEAVFTPLTTFEDEQFYSVFSGFINKYAKRVNQATSYTILPFEQWKRKYFSAMKMRLIGVFVDIAKALYKQHQQMKVEENQQASSERMGGRQVEMTAENRALLEKTTQNQIIVSPEFIEMQQKMLEAIERLDAKVNDLWARVGSVEGLVKNIYVELIK